MVARAGDLRSWLAAAALALGGALGSVCPASADEPSPLSPAQASLFESDHLASIDRPQRLDYRFEREAAASDKTRGSYRDRIALDIRPRQGGGKDVWTDFLTAERHVAFPPLMDFHGNPLIMYFLEHDVVEMHDQTGGPANFFRNHIRQAFLDRAEVRPIEVERNGRRIRATEITIQPFLGDDHLAPFAGLAQKRYRFVLSDDVPGGLVEISAEAPAVAEQAGTRETMTFAGEEPCPGDSGPCAQKEGQ